MENMIKSKDAIDYMRRTMRKKVILITGAAGEIGQALIRNFAETGQNDLLTLDLQPLPDELDKLATHIVGDVLDDNLFSRLVTEYEFDTIFIWQPCCQRAANLPQTWLIK
jgi:FlaA1/EpsC-like NDP-sugar epimerase